MIRIKGSWNDQTVDKQIEAGLHIFWLSTLLPLSKRDDRLKKEERHGRGSTGGECGD